VATLLLVAAGRNGRRTIELARGLGHRTVTVDLDHATGGEEILELARREAVNGVLAISAGPAVPVAAAVAEDLGLPGIGRETAHLLAHRVALRRRLAEHGVPQPDFAAVRTLLEGRAAIQAVGLPAVLRPADSGGQRGVFRLQEPGDLDTHLHAALAESPTQEAIVERYHEGLPVGGLAVVRSGEATVLAICDRLNPPGIGVCWINVYPTTLFGDALEEVELLVVRSVHALGLQDGIVIVLALASEDCIRVLEVSSGMPDDELAELARRAIGVDLVEAAIRQALGEPTPDELIRPQFERPLAIRFLTAEPGPLPAGRVRRMGSLDKVLAFPGVVGADTDLAVGETINPVRLDGDRHGYVIATGETNVEALQRAEAAASLVDVEVW